MRSRGTRSTLRMSFFLPVALSTSMISPMPPVLYWKKWTLPGYFCTRPMTMS